MRDRSPGPVSVFNCDDILINYVVSNLTANPPLLLQPKMPLRIIGGDGMFARGSVPVDGMFARGSVPVDAPSQDATAEADTAEADGIPTASHFEQRKLCLGHYFSHFAQFAPAMTDSESTSKHHHHHYPLVKVRTAAAQDVEDHSRWLYSNEPWEPLTGWKLADPSMMAPPRDPTPPVAEEDIDEGDEASDLDIDDMLADMSEEEIDELLLQFGSETSHPSNGEEGLGEAEEESSLFEDGEDDDEYWHPPVDHDEL